MASDPAVLNKKECLDMENRTTEITRTNAKTCISDETNTHAHVKNVDRKPEVELNVTGVAQTTEMAEVTKRMEQELSCILCLELYKNPLILPCLHSFCKACLERLIQLKCSSRNILRCPICRIGTDLTAGGVKALQKNFQLSSIVDIFKQLRKDTTVEECHLRSVIPKISKLKGNRTDDPPILQPPSNVINGHLYQPNSFYIDSESEDEDDGSELVTWNEEFQTMNQDFNFLWSDPMSETAHDDHIRIPVWSPSDSNETPSGSESPDSVNPPLPSRSLRRGALLPRSLIRSRRVISSLNRQAEQPRLNSRTRSRLVNFFKRHF